MALTQREAILLSALEFQGVFTMGDLVDVVWKRFPDMFRLIGYDLPNNQYVESKVYGSTGLVYRGLLKQTRQREFRLTDKGRKEAVALAVNGWKKTEPAPPPPPVPQPEPLAPPAPPPPPPSMIPRRSLWANHLPIRRVRP